MSFKQRLWSTIVRAVAEAQTAREEATRRGDTLRLHPCAGRLAMSSRTWKASPLPCNHIRSENTTLTRLRGALSCRNCQQNDTIQRRAECWTAACSSLKGTVLSTNCACAQIISNVAAVPPDTLVELARFTNNASAALPCLRAPLSTVLSWSTYRPLFSMTLAAYLRKHRAHQSEKSTKNIFCVMVHFFPSPVFFFSSTCLTSRHQCVTHHMLEMTLFLACVSCISL